MRTSIGEFLCKLRLAKEQKLKDMAEILGVTSAFLSVVENGKKICQILGLEKSEKNTL